MHTHIPARGPPSPLPAAAAPPSVATSMGSAAAAELGVVVVSAMAWKLAIV